MGTLLDDASQWFQKTGESQNPIQLAQENMLDGSYTSRVYERKSELTLAKNLSDRALSAFARLVQTRLFASISEQLLDVPSVLANGGCFGFGLTELPQSEDLPGERQTLLRQFF